MFLSDVSKPDIRIFIPHRNEEGLGKFAGWVFIIFHIN